MRNWRTWFKEQIVALFGDAILAFIQAVQKKQELLNKDNRFEGSHLKTDPPEYDVEVSGCRQCLRVV
jgi:hypothetical protein